MLGEIDFNLKTQKPELFLCKPDFSTIAKLNSSYSKSLKLKLGNINELTFKVPYEIDINHSLVRNPHVDLIKLRYIVKLKLNDKEEYYLISKNPSDNMDDNEDYKSVYCLSLPIELKDKLIRDYSVQSYNAEEILNDVLSNTIWTIDYIDATFNLMYRSFDFSNNTILDCVIKIAETFSALIIWDTGNRKISLFKPDNVGINRGLKFSYGKYLKSLNKDYDNESFCTQLKVFGKDGMSIQRVNPTGSNYIESFEYFMFPFQRDESRNVLSHSDYMSDSLCHAILDYNILIQTKKGEFDILLTQKESFETSLAQKYSELQSLDTELKIILDNLDLAQAKGENPTQLIADRDAKQIEIDVKIQEIEQLEIDIDNVNNLISILRNEISIENNFTPEQIIERNKFIVEKEWSDDSYIDDEDLYKEAIKKFEEFKYPPILISIDIVNFMECITEQKNWHKLNLGDIITVFHNKLNINVESKIIEIDYNFEDGSIKLVIANSKEFESNEDKLIKMLYGAISTSTKVNMESFKWNQIEDARYDIAQIVNNKWDAIKNAIEGGVNNSVSVSGRGLIIKDPDHPDRILIGQAGVIAASGDGGNTWKNSLTYQGVVAENVYGKLGIFASVRANQIIVGDQGERLSNEVIANTAFINNSSYLKFDNSGQIKINYNQIFNKYPITIEAIVQTNYYDIVGRSICHKFSSNNGFDLYLYNNRINASYYLDSTNRVRIFNVSGLEINDNKLHHISFVVDNTGGKIYIDGVLKHHNNWEGTSGVITNVDDLYIGRRGLNGSTFEGNIFEVRLWDSARTKEQIKENLFIQLDGDESNLIGYWKLNEGAGSTAKDSTSNNNHGIIETPVWRGKTSDALGNLRSDLNMSAPLPTSITLNNEGIRASTVTPDKYAQLDYRGLYIKNGAIQIDGSDGKTNYITGKYIDLGNAGLSNEGTAVGDIRIWAGSSYENRLTGPAPFRVDQGGKLTATGVDVKGTIRCDSLYLGNENIIDVTGKIISSYLTNINANQINVGTLTGFTIRTSSTTNRIVLDSNGLTGYKNGIKRINISAQNNDYHELRFYGSNEMLEGTISGTNNQFNIYGHNNINIGSSPSGYIYFSGPIDFQKNPIYNFSGTVTAVFG